MATDGNIPGLGRYVARLSTAAKREEELLTQIAQEAAEYGAQRMREFIETRGTGYVGKGPRATAEGRIDYGVMIDAVKAGKPRKTQNGASVSFGWLDVRREYFKLQEEGFGMVPPMHALLDATIMAREYFYRRIKESL
jgi:hypothetical protein